MFMSLRYCSFWLSCRNQGYEFYQHSMMQATVIEAVSSGDPDFRKILEIVDDDPITDWPQAEMEVRPEATPANHDGLEILTHTRIVDLRNWRPTETNAT